jgi:hypothetical protein
MFEYHWYFFLETNFQWSARLFYISSPQVISRNEKHNLKQGLLEKSKLAQHAYEEGQCVKWDEAKTNQNKPNSIYRKYKESTHMACLENTISQPSLEMSPIWLPIIKEIKGIQENGSQN